MTKGKQRMRGNGVGLQVCSPVCLPVFSASSTPQPPHNHHHPLVARSHQHSPATHPHNQTNQSPRFDFLASNYMQWLFIRYYLTRFCQYLDHKGAWYVQRQMLCFVIIIVVYGRYYMYISDLKMATCHYENQGLLCLCTQLSSVGANEASLTLSVQQIFWQ